MADQQQADTGVADTQPGPMPSPEADVQEVKEVAETGSQEVSQTTESEPSLPEGTRERTAKEFEKLKTQLAEEKDRRLRYERMMNTALPPQPTATNPNWYNQETGLVDVNTLHGQLSSMQQQLETANRQLQSYASREDERQLQAAYKVYPELNPKAGDKFNENFYKATVSYLAGEMAEGRPTTFKQAAEMIKSLGKTEAKKAEQEGAKKALEQLSPKEQAALEAEGRSDKRTETTDFDDLQVRTRKGDTDAIMARLKNIPPVGR